MKFHMGITVQNSIQAFCTELRKGVYLICWRVFAGSLLFVIVASDWFLKRQDNWLLPCTLALTLVLICSPLSRAGDACVPLASAHLEGALQITLDGVYHSVDTPDNWYGAEGVVDRWLESVVEELSPSPALKVSWSKALAGFFR